MLPNINFRYQKGEQQQSTENHLSPTAAFQFRRVKIKQTVKYDETLTLTEINAADKLGLTGSALVAYRLVAVVVHIRNNLPSGHCVCFMKIVLC